MPTTTTRGRREILVNVAHDLSRAENVDQLLDRIIESAREVMNCEVCSLLLPDESGDMLIRSTLSSDSGPIRVPKGKGIAGEVYLTKEVVNIRDAQQDPRHFSKAGVTVGLATHSMLTIPLLDGESCLGVMQAINARDRKHFDDEDVELFETFGSLVAVTLIRMEAQKIAVREAEYRQQLNLATEIQRSFLPPSHGEVGDLHIDAFYQPASEIGGDFYFWHPLENGRVLLGIGDVCGKGFAASLDMARASTLIASEVHTASRMPLSEWVQHINRRLCAMMSQGRFIALSFLLLSPKTRTVNVCVCGLIPPHFLRNGTWETVPHTPNPPLGVFEGLTYHSNTVSLDLSQRWLCYSDGLLEAQNERGEHYEDRALEEVLNSACSNDSNVLDLLINSWREFSTEASYRDDTTVLLVQDIAPSLDPVFPFTCRPGLLQDARDFIDRWAAAAGLDEETAGLVVLGCDEIFSNICKHAYCAEQGGPAECHVVTGPGYFEVVIEHRGNGIANEDLPDPEPPCGKIGGMGLSVVREIFDDVDFYASPQVSRITLRKNL